ncbi:MAG: sel1 repeat family protein [Clostridia bacterium]|nr:sel1 repeat family protein [Clostridia bacterium]
MDEANAAVTLEQIRAIARYELTFDQLIKDSGVENGKLVFPEAYRFTLDDLRIALTNLLAADPTVGDFGENWFFPLTQVDRAFGIDAACGLADDDGEEDGADIDAADDPDNDDHDRPIRCLREEESDIFSNIWYRLENIWTGEADDVHIAELDIVPDLIKEIDRYRANKDKPFLEREYTDAQKRYYIGLFNADDVVKKASEPELELCRKFTEELCAQDDTDALRLKGYACYGGNRLYACDWRASRDCMLKLYELTDDPTYANTLGYIYYYGRCNGGVPEYEKAFEMYAIAAANGLHEGLYKLADMFRHGYACKKSERTARSLYGMVYEDCREQFLEGRDGAFADAALRMGIVYQKGIGVVPDPVWAYEYFLQADFAAKQRAKHNNFYGDTNVMLGIRKALDETRAELPANFFEEYIKTDKPRIFRQLTENGYRVSACLKREDNDKTVVSLARQPRRGNKNAAPVLLTYAPIDYCGLVTGVKLEAHGLKTSFADGPIVLFKYDFCEWNDTEKRFDFFYDDNQIGWMACDEYRFYNTNKTKPDGKLLRLVSIAFQPGGRTYDYLCDIPDVEVGDKVVIMGYEGETVVEVKAVYTRYESELGLPLERYKKVIRKY